MRPAPERGRPALDDLVVRETEEWAIIHQACNHRAWLEGETVEVPR